MISYTTVFLLVLSQCWANKLLIELDQGRLVGKSGLDRKGNTFYSFLAIPYAKPPIGNLRFAAPQEASRWEGTLNATTDLPECPQEYQSKAFGQEDCLYLNVHTREISTHGDLKSVIVFIHGGSFIEGTGSAEYYGAEFLMPADIVLVTINYRLGVLGFLSSEDDSLNIPGNAGLKDQNMALKWVQKNIKKFGGNPESVTIVGESSGGVAVHLQMISPMGKGLFHKVVAMSGTANVPSDFGSLEFLATKLGLSHFTNQEILTKLRELSVEDILINQRQDGVASADKKVINSPVIEKEHPGAFITMEPLKAVTNGEYNKVPFMLGYTDKDGLILEIFSRLSTNKPFIINDFGMFIPEEFNLTANEAEKFKIKLKSFYFGNEEPGMNNLDKTVDLTTDSAFLSGIISTIEAHLHNADCPVYLYRFDGDTTLNYFKRKTPETSRVKGASHVDDLGHLFKTVKSPEILPGSDEDKVVDNLVGAITTFAKYGVPNVTNADWFPVTQDKLNYMNIGLTLTAGVDPDKERWYFWKEVIDKYTPVK